MKLFAKAFNDILSEDNTAGIGGAFGSGESSGTFSMGHGGAITPAEDFYAPNDTRIPKGGKKKQKKGKKSKNGELETLIPMQKRPFVVDGLN